jgi:hypothetical protein
MEQPFLSLGPVSVLRGVILGAVRTAAQQCGGAFYFVRKVVRSVPAGLFLLFVYIPLKGVGLKTRNQIKSSTLERLEQFAKESRRGMENYVGASARNVGVRWDRARKLVWVRRESSELPYYYSENS